MRVHLIRIDAQTGAGVAAPVFLASADRASLCHLDGQQWVPAIARLPVLRQDFFGGDFRAGIGTPTADFSVSAEGVSGIGSLRFARSRVRIWSAMLGDAWGSFVLRFDGRVVAEPELADGLASFKAQVDDAWLDKPLLSLFAGTGGAEGAQEIEGQAKPLVLGNTRFAPGTLIDAVNNVWMVSGHGEVQAINKAYDRVVALSGPTADYASYAALVAASIPNGAFATCRALGLVRTGAPADGQVSFDVSGDKAGAGGYVRRPGALIRRIAELAGGTVNLASLTALDTARPYNLALVLSGQTTAREQIQRIAGSVCAVAGISWTGQLFVAPLGYTTASLTLAADGTALPPVASVSAMPVGAPFWRLATQAELSWVVHDRASVASQYVVRGRYNPARIYRLDDLVDIEDGSTWVYINATPAAGNAPPAWPATSNSWWSNASPPLTADGLTYADGTPIEDLKPAEAGATVGATPAQVAAIAAAQADADAAQATADGKIETFYQATAPSGVSSGDLWFDTDDQNKLYRFNGTSWVAAQDGKIADAITAAAGAQATADGKVTTFYTTSTPTAEAVGDLWYNSSTLLLKRWSGAAWQDAATFGANWTTQVSSRPTELTDGRVSAGLTSGGVVQTGKAETTSLAASAVSNAGYTSSSSTISFAAATKTLVLSESFTKAESGSFLQVHTQIPMFGNDSVDAYIYIEVWQSGSMVAQRQFQTEIDSNGNTYQAFHWQHIFAGLSAGAYEVRTYVERYTAKTCSTVGTYHMFRQEFKR